MSCIVGFIISSISGETVLTSLSLFFFHLCFTCFSCRDLSQRLNLSEEEGEKWIVNLIRETRMGADAKIDLEKVDRLKFFHFCLLTLFFFLRRYRTSSRLIDRHYLFIRL